MTPAVSAPPTVTCELLRFAPQSDRTAVMFAALKAASSHIQIDDRESYSGVAPWLMLWGPGAPNRFGPMATQIAAGGHVIAFDLAYWNRDRKVRVSIDGPHPQRLVMTRARSSQRFEADPAPVLNHWKAKGHVVVAGIGEKATAQYGAQVTRWETEMISEAKARGRQVAYRPKKAGPIPSGVSSAVAGPIDQALRGASLVITWHSNVAVDAIRLGIPVICRDGAAAAVCPSTWPAEGMPQPLDLHMRMQFLHNLAWFQWDPKREAAACWAFLSELLS